MRVAVIDVGTVTITIEAIPGSGYTTPTPIQKTFQITPAKLVLTWNDKRVFQYDGTPHLRTGVVTVDPTTPTGETPTCTITGEQINVGTDYVATAGNFAITDGQRKISNYTLPTNVTATFDIVTLPIDEEKPTDDPEDPQDPTPIDPQDPDYTVEIVIEWPDEEYTYTGEPQGPVPTVKLVITNEEDGTKTEVPLTSGDDYKLIYTNNVDAGKSGDPGCPQVVIEGDGTNITGTTDPHPYTIKPAVIKVTADNKTKQEGSENPALTYTETQGAVHGETAAYTGAIACAATTATTVAESPVAITQGTLALADGAMGTQGTAFKASNYTLEFTNGELTITAPADKEIKAADNRSKIL